MTKDSKLSLRAKRGNLPLGLSLEIAHLHFTERSAVQVSATPFAALRGAQFAQPPRNDKTKWGIAPGSPFAVLGRTVRENASQ